MIQSKPVHGIDKNGTKHQFALQFLDQWVRVYKFHPAGWYCNWTPAIGRQSASSQEALDFITAQGFTDVKIVI